MTHEDKLTDILRDNGTVMNILHIAREAHLPNWYVGAGVIRNAVWDSLHDKPGASPIRDIDCIYYSVEDIDEVPIKKYLASQLPGVDWDIKNSRHVHEWYKVAKGIDRPQLTSTEDDIRQWPEIATCIGVRLLEDDTFHICAPYGLDDLMDMVWGPNLHDTYRPQELTMRYFNERTTSKKVLERWPMVQVKSE